MNTLYVIEGDYGLISLDVDCIQSILFAKLYKVPIEIKLLNTVKLCAFYTAPCLGTDSVTIQLLPNIISQWKNAFGNTDQLLSAKEMSETLALETLVTMKFRPVLDFVFWVDPRNCEEFTNCWYMKALPFPFNYSYTKRKKNEAMQLIEALYPLDTDLEVIKEYIRKRAIQCLSTLSTRLGKSNFFYGDSPKSLDVIVYAHIAPLVKLPFPANDIPSLAAMWPNLNEFVKRIDQKYYPDVKRNVKYLKREEVNRQSDDEVSYTAVCILIFSATSLVLGFAIKRGFIKISNFL